MQALNNTAEPAAQDAGRYIALNALTVEETIAEAAKESGCKVGMLFPTGYIFANKIQGAVHWSIYRDGQCLEGIFNG